MAAASWFASVAVSQEGLLMGRASGSSLDMGARYLDRSIRRGLVHTHQTSAHSRTTLSCPAIFQNE